MAEPQDDPAFAELLDDLLDQVLDGSRPDLEAAAARHPAAAHRVDEAYALAANLAGRKISNEPKLQDYEIVRELGRGGMGTVYLARQTSLEREVALKVLPHSFGLSAAGRLRFLDEARALAHVEHENVVTIHRIVDDGDLLAFEMEYIDGPSLHTLLTHLRQARGRGDAPTDLQLVATLLGATVEQLQARNLTQFFVRLTKQIARALGAMHDAGLVHRDVKPANVLLRKNGDPVVVDFGLVRPHSIEATQAGRFAGTPVYSSPEQLRGDPLIGPATDVYGLGVTLYECLTLTTPFTGHTTTALLQRIEQGRLPALRKLAPEAPLDLQTIVHHALEADPDQRYANGNQLGDDLQRLLELRPITARPVGVLRRLDKLMRRNSRPLIAGVVGALLVIATTIPILHRIEARERADERARLSIATGRDHLVRIDAGDLEWTERLRGDADRQPAGGAEQHARTLRDALAAYVEARAGAPLAADAEQEFRTVRLAAWLHDLEVPRSTHLTEALDGLEFARVTAGLGAATVTAARVYAGDRATELPDADGAAADDRRSLGLLAYLCGDKRTCEAAWSTEPNASGDVLVDAGLGRLLLADDLPEDAYARLLQAHARMPDSASLTLALADAALRRGDLRKARSWLAQVDPTSNLAERPRIKLDVRSATSPGEDLTGEYRALAVRNPYDPTPRFRIAQLALRRGDLAAAERQLEDLVETWPEAPSFRLARARVALLRRDLPGYGRQVLAVLQRDFGKGRSRGAIANYLELLRIGGLESLHLEGIRRTGHESTGHRLFGDELPIAAFAPPAASRNFAECARLLEWLRAETARINADSRRIDGVSEFFLERLPLFAQRIPAIGNGTVLRACALRVLPRIAPVLYEVIQPTVRRMLVDLNFAGWQRVPLQRLERPTDVPFGTVFGGTMRAVPDTTGDGITDVLVGSTASHPKHGESRVLLVDGRTMAIVATLAGSSPHHLFGFALGAVGDVDADGVDDWVIGSPSGSTDDQRGHAEVWSGASRRRIHVLRGDGPGFGASVAGIGDRDGDGHDDFAVATVPIVRNRTPQGDVRIYSGRTFEQIGIWRNEVPGIWFGGCMENVGDANGDGRDDVVVGGNYGDAPGLARLYDGHTDAILHSWTVASTTAGFASKVTGVGDIDEDGHADVAVSAFGWNRKERDEVTFYSGRTGERLVTSRGARAGDRYGNSVLAYAGSGSRKILVIGAPHGGEPRTGVFWLTTNNKLLNSHVVGPRIRGAFGWSLALVDDLDGDGLPEFFVAGVADGDNGIVWRVMSRDVYQLRGF